MSGESERLGRSHPDRRPGAAGDVRWPSPMSSSKSPHRLGGNAPGNGPPLRDGRRDSTSRWLDQRASSGWARSACSKFRPQRLDSILVWGKARRS